MREEVERSGKIVIENFVKNNSLILNNKKNIKDSKKIKISNKN
jgi:hypothetical protein